MMTNLLNFLVEGIKYSPTTSRPPWYISKNGISRNDEIINKMSFYLRLLICCWLKTRSSRASKHKRRLRTKPANYWERLALTKDNSLSVGGKLSLTTLQLMKSSAHLNKSGNFSTDNTSIPAASWMVLSQMVRKLAAMSTIPIASPPKNLFPFSALSSVFRHSQASSTAFSRSFSGLNAAFLTAGKHYMYTRKRSEAQMDLISIF